MLARAPRALARANANPANELLHPPLSRMGGVSHSRNNRFERSPAGFPAGCKCPQCRERPLKHNARGVLIASQGQAAITNMHSLGKRLLALPTAARACLRWLDLARRNVGKVRSSFFRFLSQHLQVRGWSGGQNLAIQARLLGDVAPRFFNRAFRRARHVLDGQRFSRDQICCCNDLR